MIVGVQEVTGVVPVDLWGVVRRELVLVYAVADPVAVRLEVNGGCWYVARRRLVEALGAGRWALDDVGDEGAAAVQLSRLPGVCGEYLRVVVRPAGGGYWPMAVRAECLAEFLARTYAACSPSRERRLVEAELAVQLELFAATGGS